MKKKNVLFSQISELKKTRPVVSYMSDGSYFIGEANDIDLNNGTEPLTLKIYFSKIVQSQLNERDQLETILGSLRTDYSITITEPTVEVRDNKLIVKSTQVGEVTMSNTARDRILYLALLLEYEKKDKSNHH